MIRSTDELIEMLYKRAYTINADMDDTQSLCHAAAMTIERFAYVTERAHECPRCHMKWISAPKGST